MMDNLSRRTCSLLWYSLVLAGLATFYTYSVYFDQRLDVRTKHAYRVSSAYWPDQQPPTVDDEPALDTRLQGDACLAARTCPAYSTCRRVDGKDDCVCWGGYERLQDGSCADVNECLTANGGCEHRCRNSRGGFGCFCHEGYRLVDRFQCEDVDECTADIDFCYPGTCVYTECSFHCECPDGYQGDMTQQCYAREIVMFSADMHRALIADYKELFWYRVGPMLGVKIVWEDYNLQGRCHHNGTCHKPPDLLKVLEAINGWQQAPNPHVTRRDFFERYKSSELFDRVDVIVSTHPCANAQVFFPFNKSQIVVCPMWPDVGVDLEYYRQRWYQDMLKLSTNPRHVIASNNYENYKQFFTSKHSLVPDRSQGNWYVRLNYCGYPRTSRWFAPRLDSKAIIPMKCEADPKPYYPGLNIVNQRSHANSSFPFVIEPNIRNLLPQYDFEDLGGFPAIIYIPHHPSTMAFMEMYRMNIPIITPKANGPFDRFNGKRDVDHPEAWPYVLFFDRPEDIWDLLLNTDLEEVSRKMAVWNQQALVDITEQWVDHLETMLGNLETYERPKVPQEPFDDVLLKVWNATLEYTGPQTSFVQFPAGNNG
eukprot:TRINITY_DN1407_c0_g5_i1.p1 TRINITY_DN1407_c0_g5~~TRINITY_DN1407_c0_g5_i1.p1  ORF type:complete len:594 (+),score=115.26 TRINITY_DN1407_c0_g5_i1:1294-3075(+)